MKLLITTILICFSALAIFAQQKSKPQFSDFKVTVYKGKIKNPKWAKRISNEEWRDELGKFYSSTPPQINFAGKYFITLHSCGTGCGYYNFTDLSTGKELGILGMFSYGDEEKKTTDGFSYTPDLFYQKDSKLLIVHFMLEKDGKEKGCRERAFVFDGKKLVPTDKGKMKPLTQNYTKCRQL
ncbi:MAG: hypothetical protein MUC29_01025 [Pyrinomonadaceae bacterium]|jgi:hypothetical protein|nr:hypothetical protein [Pyrinomonadaceae bacterium]